MAVGRAAGYPDYTYDGANKLIPIIFAGETLRKFYDATVLAAISNTNYTGEIKKKGDKVIIRTVPDVTIRPYYKGTNLILEYPESPAVELTVDYADYFNFAMDDIDLHQTDIKDWISKLGQDAAEQIKINIDDLVLGTIYADADSTNKGATAGAKSASFDLGTTTAPVALSKSNILDYMIDCGTCLDENNIPETGRWMVIPPWAAGMIKKSDLKDASLTGDGESILRNGRIGRIDRWTLYISNLLEVTSPGKYHVLYGQQEALTFVAQITKTEMYRPDNTFADAMKGLTVYGFGVLQPTALGELVATKS